MKHKFLKLYFALCFMLLFCFSASAYIDPATTSYIIQIIAGLMISLGVVFATMSAKIKAFFINFRVNMLKRKIMRETKKATGIKSQLQKSPATTTKVADAPISKWEFIWGDKRPIRERLIIALLVSFSFVFTFIIFGTYDLYINNIKQFSFSLSDIWLILLIVGLGIFAIISSVLIMFRGRLFDLLISLLFGILIAGYIQGNFLNIRLGQLTGDLIAWQAYTVHGMINLIIWLVIIAIPLVIRLFGRNVWKSVICFISAILIAMQSIALVSSISDSKVLAKKNENRYLSTQGLYEVSDQENIIIILLDRFDQKYIKNTLRENPNFYDNLDGFTQFMNNTSYYCRTFPSAVNILTGAVSLYDTPADTFFKKAWGESTFIPDLRNNGFTTKMYMEKPYLYTDIKQIDGLADNIVNSKITIRENAVIKDFLMLSAFRYAPHSLKANFYISTADFGDIITSEEGPKPYVTDDAKFYRDLKANKLVKSEKKKNFVYYHLNGMHDYVLNENAERTGSMTSELEQMRACFKIVNEFLEQLKEQGLYKDSTIIITGDHGKSTDVTRVEAPILTGLFVKPKGSAGTPLKHSYAPVSQAQLRSTVIAAAGLDNSAYGPTYFDIPEDADVVRPYYYRLDEDGKHYLEEFEIRGDANDFKNWHKKGELPIKYVHG